MTIATSGDVSQGHSEREVQYERVHSICGCSSMQRGKF